MVPAERAKTPRHRLPSKEDDDMYFQRENDKLPRFRVSLNSSSISPLDENLECHTSILSNCTDCRVISLTSHLMLQLE